MGIFLNKCDNCNKLKIGKKPLYTGELCEDCYWNAEIMECETCGREITKADYVDFKGECIYCDGFYDAFCEVTGTNKH